MALSVAVRRFNKRPGKQTENADKPHGIQQLEARYKLLAAQIGSFESLSQRSVMPQAPRAWRWTRKVGGKTVSLGLTPEKAAKMEQAIANHRSLDKIIREVRAITQKLILEAPETTRISTQQNRPKPPLS